MRFLIDENLSPQLCSALRDDGHDAVHVRDLGMAGDDYATVLDAARSGDRTLSSADTDFGGPLARTHARLPSVVLIRRLQGRRAAAQAALILEHLIDVRHDLEVGSVIAFDEGGVRIRRLPI